MNPDGSLNIFRNQKQPFWTDISHGILSITWPKFFLFVGLIYIFVNFFFAVIYFALGHEGLQGIRHQDGLHFFTECFFFSVQTFSTIGYGQISPVGLGQNIVVAIQALTGMLSIGLISGLFFTRFLKPTSKVVYANKALITTYNGQPAFIFRMANSRQNQIVEASVKVSAIRDTELKEGGRMRLLADMPLVRDRNSVFALSWTVIHIIDKDSPLYNLSPDAMRAANMEVFVNVTGYDETFSNTVHSRRSYVADEIEFNRFYEDMMFRKEGRTAVDLSKISLLKPVP